jgi:hypothetical protein
MDNPEVADRWLGQRPEAPVAASWPRTSAFKAKAKNRSACRRSASLNIVTLSSADFRF